MVPIAHFDVLTVAAVVALILAVAKADSRPRDERRLRPLAGLLASIATVSVFADRVETYAATLRGE